jgi:hypothetical protein
MTRITIIGPILLFTLVALLLASCTDRPHYIQPFQARLDSMEQKLRHTYTPGFGELMLNIQIHHAKLWFAGKNGNWELAAYDQSLIRSAFQKIRSFHPDNPNSTATAMIDIPMDSIGSAITRKDPAAFQRSFGLLTTTCNNCHAVTKHAFNLITIPKTEPIGNQSYSLIFAKNN